jgi:hypothetical protein
MTGTRIALLIALALALLVPALAQGAPMAAGPAPAASAVTKDPAAAALAQARRLSADWGRCPTSRPAHRLLGIATRTRAPRPRVQRARAALRAWRLVAADCSKPLPQPSVIVGDAGFVPPPA